MKAYNLLLLTILSAPLLIDAQITVPDCASYANGVYLPDPYSCSSYFVCRNGLALRRRCARGFRFDDTILYCNFAALVDCSRVNRAIGDAGSGSGSGSASACSTTPPCTTTTVCTTKPPCTTTTCTTTPPCTTTTCTTTPPCTTTTCTTTPPCTTTTCTTTPPCTTTTCTTTDPCTTPTTCTTTSNCSTPSTPCNTTPCPPSTPEPDCDTKIPTLTPTPAPDPTDDTTTKQSALRPSYYSRRACQGLADGTILLDAKHCRKFYICNRSRGRKQRCNRGEWYDFAENACRPRAEVTNCQASCD